MNHTTPRVFATCLAAYNNGHLHGRWIDATDPDDMRAEIADILASSPIPDAEEYFFSDTEGFGHLVFEYTRVDQVARLGALIEEHGLEPVELVAESVNCNAGDIERHIDEVERYSAGQYVSKRRTLECWAQEQAEEYGDVPSWLHIDWEATARDLLLGYHHDFADNGDLLLLHV